MCTQVDSFFNFFSPPEVPGDDDEMEEEQMEELQALIEADYEVRKEKEWLVRVCVSVCDNDEMEQMEELQASNTHIHFVSKLVADTACYTHNPTGRCHHP